MVNSLELLNSKRVPPNDKNPQTNRHHLKQNIHVDERHLYKPFSLQQIVPP